MKNKYQVIPFAVLSTLFIIGFSVMASAGRGEKSPTTSIEEVLPPESAEARTEDDEIICGLKEVVCPFEAKKTYTAWATITAYTSDPKQTDDTPEISANGQNIWKLYQKNENTCASNDYKFGTKIKIAGLGVCTVRDRMNKRYSGKNRLDWYYGYNIISAIRFGIKKLPIYVEETN